MSRYEEQVASGDFCPTCDVVVTIDWHIDERTGWDVHDACSTALVPRDKYAKP